MAGLVQHGAARAGSLFLVGFQPDGSVAFAESIPGTADARPKTLAGRVPSLDTR